MKDTNRVSLGYYHSEECNLADFQKIIDQKLAIDSVPHANEIKKIFLFMISKNYKIFFKVML